MKNPNLCAVAIGDTMGALLQNIALCKKAAPFVEVRSDYVSGRIDLKQIEKRAGKNSIFTCRRKDELGKWYGLEKDRLMLLAQAFSCGFSYVDVELKTMEEGFVNKGMEAKTLMSFHDFERTPSVTELQKIISRMRRFSPGIMKIATLVRDENDEQALYTLLISRSGNEKLCVIGMGIKGRRTRMIGPLLGGCLAYCSINTEGSAPGQMTCEEMNKCYRLLQ